MSSQLSVAGSQASDVLDREVARDEEIRKLQTLMKDLHAEATVLHAEAARMQQQNLFYERALDSLEHESLNWIKGLAGLLALCITALGWLLWRASAMKHAALPSWSTPFLPQHTGRSDVARVEGQAPSLIPESSLATVHAISDEASNDATSAISDGATSQQTIDNEQEQRRHATIASASPPSAVRTTQKKTGTVIHPAPPQILKAEEIADVMELVDAWMTRNAPEKVLELLRLFSDVEQPESPLPWLCLLDVYRALGDQQKYEAILGRIKAHFNVKLASWNVQAGCELPKTLSDFPHVVTEIASLWQTAAVLPYLQRLLHDDRNGTRHGFDLPAYRDILRLIALVSEHGQRLQRGEIMSDEEAHAILFGAGEQKTTGTSVPPAHDTNASASPAASPTADMPEVRKRPKHAATPGDHAIERRQRRKSRPDRIHDSPATNDIPLEQAAGSTKPTAPSALVAPNLPHAWVSPEDLSPMAIKLHLAIAYQDIGDHEGACLLLDEVLHGGTEEQSRQAKRLLEKLA